jgi:hypothetical protein
MPRRSAIITQADIARAIRAAKQAGAVEVEVRLPGQATITIRLNGNIEIPRIEDQEIIL